MEIVELLLRGFITGLIITAPMGPAGILCVRRIFNKRGLSGLLTGYGSATADIIFAILAGFSISIISEFIIQHKGIFELIAALMLIIIGIKELLLKNNPRYRGGIIKQNLAKDYLSGFLITILNPLTIISFIAAYTLIGISTVNGFKEPFFVVIGSMLGTIFGWTALSFVLVKIKRKTNLKILSQINKVSGTILIIFGLILVAKVVHIF